MVGKYNATFEDLGFKKVKISELLKVVFTAYIVYLLITYSLSLILNATGVSVPGYQDQESYIPLFGKDLMGYAVGFLLVGVLAPFIEEILFRGFIYRVFIKTWPLWFGSILSAALFALIHVQFQTFIPLFILGLLLNYSYNKTGSLWTSIVLHSMNNILAFAIEVYFSLHPEALAYLAQAHTFVYTVQIS